MTTRPHVVIIGGGFAGLAAAKKLAKSPVDVTLLDRKNHHVFQPLLYQVATAGLNPADIAHPIRRALRRQKNCRVLLCDVQEIDATERVLRYWDPDGKVSSLGFDYLIVAAGATHAYFGNDHWAASAPGLKTVEDAIEIRRRVLLAFERAELATDDAARQANMNFVVVGAGPTGVEMAGAIAEIATTVLTKDFRLINPADAKVLLVEGTDRVLGAFPEKLSTKAVSQLEALGVEVRLNTLVTDITDQAVLMSDTSTKLETRLETNTVVWGAGVAASPLGQQLETELDRAGRVVVNSDLSLPGVDHVFVVGDLAAVVSDGVAVPGVAPAAAQAGRHAAEMIVSDMSGQKRRDFRYRDKGSLATIGRSSAVASFGTKRKPNIVNLSGFVAWVLWWAVHIMFLIDFRSRVYVMAGWGWQWMTFQRGARLITGTPSQSEATPQAGAKAVSVADPARDSP